MTAPELLLTAEVAELLRVPASTLRTWRYEDKGPRSFKAGTRVVYDRADVMAWVESQKATTSRGAA